MTAEFEDFLKKQKIRVFGDVILREIQQKFDDTFHPQQKTLKALEEIKQRAESLESPSPKEQS